MTLSERIEKDYITAYKAKEQLTLDVLRLLKTAAKNMLVELKRTQGSLDDAEMMDVILRQAKQRQDSIVQFNDANRPDLAEKEAAELKILQIYLPQPLTAEELSEVIEKTIADTGAQSPKDMGKVMGLITSAYKGRVDGKVLSEMVRTKLTPAS